MNNLSRLFGRRTADTTATGSLLFKSILTLLVVAVPFTVQTSTAQHSSHSDIVDTAVAAGSFKTLAAALSAADLIDVLKSDGPFTVFAPTDEAFAALPAGTVEDLLKPENKAKLAAILTYHVVSGKVAAKDVVKLNGAATVNGQRAKITVKGGKVMVDGANVVSTDVMASNGIIHVIDAVILPSFDTIPAVASSAGTFNTLVAAVKAAGLADVLSGDGPFTVFAPTDEAFAALPAGTVDNLLKPENLSTLQGILKYHVTAGRMFSEDVVAQSSIETLNGTVTVATRGGVRVNNANVVATDINASNGVIHVIDTVLLPAKEKSSVETARDIILLAVNRAVPLFNNGNADGCAAVYEVAAASLIAMQDLPGSVRAELAQGLQKMNTQHSSVDQAWTMRYALDSALESMSAPMATSRH